jgi:hypothetical protein
MAKRVKDYWPGDFERDMRQALTWLFGRQNAPAGNWQANALGTATTQPMWQCGIVSTDDLSTFDQAAIENIVFDVPTGVIEDATSVGPDGFPINYSPTVLPSAGGQIFLNTFMLSAALTVGGRCLSLLSPAAQYRVDLFVHTDVWYYKGSTTLSDQGEGVATWSASLTHSGTPGALIAALYPTSVAQPAPDWFGATLPAGWRAHTNMGVGRRLLDYIGRVYSKTDIEYLQEDNLPVIVQDAHHARLGSTRVMGAGTPTMHLIANDPVAGWLNVFSTLQHLAVFADLPRSLDIPISDPLFVPDVTLTNSAALQHRSWIYDVALAIIAYTSAGNFAGARRIIAQLNKFLDSPEYLAETTLENGEDGSTARWTIAGDPGASITMWNDPLRAPFGGGKQMQCHAAATGDSFTYIGPAVYGGGLPDSTDHIIQWQFRAASSLAWYFEVALTTQQNSVTKLKVTSDGPGAPTYDGPSKTITYPLGPGNDDYHFYEFDLKDLCATLAAATWTSTTGFKIVLQQPGDLHLDNLSLGKPQPEGSLGFSYDVYNGLPDQAYIRTGAMAWVAYAYAFYMEAAADATPALYLQKMLNFLLTLESTDADLRNGLLKGGFGRYVDPGYHFEPGLREWVSTEHNIDAWYAFRRAARVLPSAATELLKRGLITGAQATALGTTAAAVSSKSDNIKTKILSALYIAPGTDPGHFAQGVNADGTLDTAVALDAAGSWAAIFCHEAGDDTKAAECLKFIHQKLFLTNQTIVKSNASQTWNMAYEQLTPFDGFTVYGAGYTDPPPAVWGEGTWGVIAALLRCQDVSAVQTYFAATEGSLDQFLSRLTRSQKTVHTTTGNGSLLNYSLASRSLPYEFSVWAGVGSTAWMWLTAWNPTLLLASETSWEWRPYLKIPQGVQQSIRQLEGQGSIGALEIEAVDVGGYLTALASGGKLEGRRAALKVGYPGMASSDFVTVATQDIEAVSTLPDLTGYVLECRDPKRSAKSKIFTRGDDGYPVSNDHPRTLLANPMDVVLMVFQNELGLGQVPALPESAWMIYDPAQWNASGTENPTLLRPNSWIDVEQFLFYRNGIFSGYLMDFTVRQAPEAKQFLEHEIFRALGGYLVVLADGRLSPRFFYPPTTFANLATFSDRNITVLPGLERHPIINQVTFRMDYDGSKFQTELLFVDAPSLQQFGLAGQHIIESKGMKLARGGASLAGLTATRIFRRYAGFNPTSGASQGGATLLTVKSHYMTLTVEVGDFVFLSHPLLPNFETGQRGVAHRICEVLDKQPDFAEGAMTYGLLDLGWVAAKQLSLVAPQGTPAYTAASTTERARYMFVSGDATETYSDGTAGKTIW